MSTYRVVVVDDQDLVRSGLAALLDRSESIQVVGQAGNGVDGVELVRRQRPDVAFIDIRMPVCNGIEAIRQIRADPALDAVRLVVLTTFDLDEYVLAALRAGADGFLLKNTSPEELVRSVQVVAAGDALLSPPVTRRVLEQLATHPGARHGSSLPDLTARESDVLALVCEGLTNSAIGKRLFIGTETVKTYIGRLLDKFSVASRVSLAIAAVEAGFDHRGHLVDRS